MDSKTTFWASLSALLLGIGNMLPVGKTVSVICQLLGYGGTIMFGRSSKDAGQ